MLFIEDFILIPDLRYIVNKFIFIRCITIILKNKTNIKNCLHKQKKILSKQRRIKQEIALMSSYPPSS